MNRFNKQELFEKLRKDYPYFVFERFHKEITRENIVITFDFSLSDKIFFHPKIQIPLKPYINNANLSQDLDNVIFQIGLIELLSYWKAACSPKVMIKPFVLEKEQIDFWKHLYFNGLGEFFYVNSIETDEISFMDIKSATEKQAGFSNFSINEKKALIPVGGGKDSVVSMELIKQTDLQTMALIINPRQASFGTAKIAGYDDQNIITINRTIDPQLLQLNEKGFLNGHTPFSSLLAFVSVYIAALTGSKYIVLSNESSANESTIENTSINHQYSKGIEFESNFRNYVRNWVSSEIDYFSLLRPMNELQIAKYFAEQKQYHHTFKSCNVGSKSDIWCCNCPKCLFTCIILSPFVENKQLTSIFGENLFEKESLAGIFDQLTGIAENKPFECVGTIDEINYALVKTIEKYGNIPLPFLLQYYKNSKLYNEHRAKMNLDMEYLVSNEHFIPKKLENLIELMVKKHD